MMATYCETRINSRIFIKVYERFSHTFGPYCAGNKVCDRTTVSERFQVAFDREMKLSKFVIRFWDYLGELYKVQSQVGHWLGW